MQNTRLQEKVIVCVLTPMLDEGGGVPNARTKRAVPRHGNCSTCGTVESTVSNVDTKRQLC